MECLKIKRVLTLKNTKVLTLEHFIICLVIFFKDDYLSFLLKNATLENVLSRSSLFAEYSQLLKICCVDVATHYWKVPTALVSGFYGYASGQKIVL